MSDAPSRIWAFDRYMNGVLMAEGIEITRAASFEEACVSAARLASRGPRGEVPVLVLATPAAHEAADRIEALVTERDGLLTTWAESRNRHLAAEARAERMEAALRKIAEGNFIGRAEGYAFAALHDATANVVTHGIGIMQDGKRIAPQDFFAVRDVDDKS